MSTNLEKQAHEQLIQAFSEMDPRNKPWCGISGKGGILAISPIHVTVAVVIDTGKITKGLVHVPQNWREQWYVEAVDGQKYPIQGNPCDQAERALYAIKKSLRTFLKTNEHAEFAPQCLIICPDECDFVGPKEFSILDHDEVSRLKIKKFRELSPAILLATRPQKLDRRKYRNWLESCIIQNNRDSLIGTWLDPAFDPPDTEPSQRPSHRRSSLRRIATNKQVADQEIAPNKAGRTQPKWPQVKVFAAGLITISIAVVGWRLYRGRPASTASQPASSISLLRAEDSPAGTQIVEAAATENSISLTANDNPESLPDVQTAKLGDAHAAEETRPQLHIVNRKTRTAIDASENSASENSEAKRLERQVRDAILLRAIKGVTVSITADTARLEGLVATEDQRAAADKAARSVPGIRNLQNGIEVKALPANE